MDYSEYLISNSFSAPLSTAAPTLVSPRTATDSFLSSNRVVIIPAAAAAVRICENATRDLQEAR